MKRFFCEATRHLGNSDADWAELISRVGPCGLTPRPEREPYEALIRAIAYQQLHARAAESILQRFLSLFPDAAFPTPQQILATDETRIRASGFSKAKIAAIRDIADKTLAGLVPTHRQALELDDETLVAQLTSLRGVGRWTVEMLLIFNLQRPDILPVDDFGVRKGWQLMKSLEDQPTPRQMRDIGRDWSPFRSTATWYLWRAVEQATQRAQMQ